MAFVKSIPADQEGVPVVMNRYPEQNSALCALTEHIMRTGECSFSHEQREMIAAYTSGTNDCTFCYNTHKETAKAFGVEEDLLTAMVNDIDNAPVDENMKPVFRYVQKLTKNPSKLIQADADAIFAAGWDENDFHYVVMVTALFNLYNRIMDGYGVVNTPEYWSQGGEMLAAMGYSHEVWGGIVAEEA